jgi:hypothetical protein
MTTAFEDGYRVLYHWQTFNTESGGERLVKTLGENVVYCSRPSDFNDPWDCKPFYNLEILADDKEREWHAEWAVNLCRRRTDMTEQDIATMRETLRTNEAKARTIIRQISDSIVEAITERYRVYCLGPDLGNLLMWSHYADSHRGVCLEFNLRNDVMCGALKCEYQPEFPILKLRDNDIESSLLPLLSKVDVWCDEKEYRVVAQERKNAVGADTLMTDDGFLNLPDGAIASVVVGCQADYAAVEVVVRKAAPGLRLRRAVRLPDRYAVKIEG